MQLLPSPPELALLRRGASASSGWHTRERRKDPNSLSQTSRVPNQSFLCGRNAGFHLLTQGNCVSVESDFLTGSLEQSRSDAGKSITALLLVGAQAPQSLHKRGSRRHAGRGAPRVGIRACALSVVSVAIRRETRGPGAFEDA